MKKEKTFTQRLIPFIVIAILLYTIAAIVLQFVQGVEISSTLTVSYFTFFSVELVSLSLIKIGKVRNIKDYKDVRSEIKNALDENYEYESEENNECEYEEYEEEYEYEDDDTVTVVDNENYFPNF